MRRSPERTLTVTHEDGATEDIPVFCGSHRGARRLPRRVGRALVAGTATATLDYDGETRTAVQRGGEYYMRLVDTGEGDQA